MTTITVREAGNGIDFNFTLTAPNVLLEEGYYERQAYVRLGRLMEKYARRLKRAGQLGYRFDTLRSRFEVIQTASGKADRFVAGVSTADPIFSVVEFNTAPHMPPPRRHDQPHTGIEGWVERFGYPGVTTFMVQSIIGERGTEGRLVLTKELKKQADEFKREVTELFVEILSGR